jgi:UDPglucose 6-dehydrogenase
MKVAVLGLWHLGCVTAVCCGEHFDVVGLDFDEEVIANLKLGRPPIFEPGLGELLERGLDAGKLSFTTDANAVADADVLWVCIDTPVDEADCPDVEFVLGQIDRCVPCLRPDTTVLISSQLPAGTCRQLESKYAKQRLFFACSPENLRLGKALEIFRHPDRVVVGVRDAPARETLTALFLHFGGETIVWMTPESAEMTKHAINSFLALSVTFANEVARICESVGADAREVERGLRSESRIGPRAYIRPGSAFAGGTLARDVVTLTRLAHSHGVRADLAEAVLKSNDAHKDWAIQRLKSIYGNLKEIEVAVLGLTYKPNTDTLRRSGAVEIAEKLLALDARVRCHDPLVDSLPESLAAAQSCGSAADAVRGADAVLVATEWPQFKQENWPSLVLTMKASPVILDPNGFLELKVEALPGVRYFVVGSVVT